MTTSCSPSVALEEGDACPQECGGVLYLPEPEGCSCHINPPCGACTGVVLTCRECGWEDEDIDDPVSYTPPDPSISKARAAAYAAAMTRDLGDGKRLLDIRCDSRSGSTMVYRGRFSGPVTAADIFKVFGDGSFGHRGPTLSGNSFEYTLITD